MMKRLSISIAIIAFIQLNSFAQKIDTLKLKVVAYKELKDCYIINTYNAKTSDSVYIISMKTILIFNCNYEKIIVGKEYNFECKENNVMPRQPLNNFALRVKHTYVWKQGDDPKKIPVFSTNSKGLFVRKIRVHKGSGFVSK